MMPEVSGKDVYEALRLLSPPLLSRLVLMTGGAFTRQASEFLADLNAPILEKPFEARQLRAIVNANGRFEADSAGVVLPAVKRAEELAIGHRKDS
jgi:hypothetical protein